MLEQNTHELWEKEKALISELRSVRPELLTVPEKNTATILYSVGITPPDKFVCRGYLKTTPLDFIVEEIQLDGSITGSYLSKYDTYTQDDSSENATVYATLVKVGISTLEAIEQIALALHIDKDRVGYAGIKDAVAVTSQKISIRGVTVANVQDLSLPQVVLKDIFTGKGIMNFGNIKGNRFSIVIRTTEKINQDLLQNRIQQIIKNGLINYYGPQRFGSPRYQSHVLGRLVLRKEYKTLVHTILVHATPFEWPVVISLREKAKAFYGDWQKMKEIFLHLPYTFRQEILLLDRLASWSEDLGQDQYFFALSAIIEQLDFWVKSYASFLTNELLSFYEKSAKELPETIPLLLNTRDSDLVDTLYGFYLKRDGTQKFRETLKTSRFIRRGENSYIQIKLFPENIDYVLVDGAVVLGFDLPKGAYATTLLYELFDLEQPEEDETIEQARFVDSKKLLKREGDILSLGALISEYIKK